MARITTRQVLDNMRLNYDTFVHCDRVLNIAHQGGKKVRPEHTMIAFEQALIDGADVLELDVHSAQDGVLDRAGKPHAGDRIDRKCRWIFPVTYFGLIAVMVAVAFTVY
jgi:hypothetical protein